MSGNHDETIDAVLNALQQVEPDPAMQARILSALQTVEAAWSTPASGYRWPHPAALRGVALPWLVAAALLLAAGGTLLLQRYESRGIRPDQVTQSASAALGTGIPASPKGKSSPGLEGAESATPSNSATLLRVPHVSQRHGIRLQTVAEAHVSETRRGASFDLTAERSFPAPPLPLTEQERLLVQLVRHEPSGQLAQLSKPVLDAAFQREKDHVTEFFVARPPLPGQQEPPSYISQTGQQ